VPVTTLSRTRDDYRKLLGYHAGYGSAVDSWDDEQTYNVDRVLDVALATFYYPDLGEASQYQWTFLKPNRTFTLASGARFLDLPDDFGGFLDPTLNVLSDDRTLGRVRIGDAVRGLYARSPDAHGPPQSAELALGPGPDLAGGSRYRLHVYPESRAEYRLQGHIAILPEALSDRRPYVYGSAAHHMTVEAACYAAWETVIDEVDPDLGVKNKFFRQRLRASVAADRRNQPKNYGYNSDSSDLYHLGRTDEYRTLGGYGVVTIDGQEP